MFENLHRDLKAKEENNKVEIPTISISQNLSLNSELFKEKLMNISQIQPNELLEIIRHSYATLLDEIFINKNNELIRNVIYNPTFLMALNQVLSNVKLTYSQQIYCNKLAYDYISLKNSDIVKDSTIRDLLYNISKTVNRSVIPGLLGIDLPENLASYLALSRFSSAKGEHINIKRVNFIIMTSPIELMTEQRIVWIYEKLFDYLTPLFEFTMLDTCKDFDSFTNPDEAREIYSIISLAILDILNNSPSESIRKVLMTYAGDYHMLHAGKPVRFSMNSLAPEDYSRINSVIESLAINEQIYLP